MPLMPILVQGKIRLVNLPSGAGSKERARAEEENARRLAIAKRRRYLDGEQYDDENVETMKALGLDPLTDRLPEHMRKHSYSTEIEECVTFLCDQLADSFGFECESPDVQEVLTRALELSDQMTGGSDDADVDLTDVLFDALVAGDVAVEVKWDPIEGAARWEFWDSEQVQFEFRSRTEVERVIREELVWVEDVTGEKQVVERVVYEVVPNGAVVEQDGSVLLVQECRKATFWDDEEEPRSVEWLGVPFIPWCLLRVNQKGLRSLRGQSMISDQTMAHADRLNANLQVSFLIARYNSHGNVVVVGDAAHLSLKNDEYVSKDVADVLAFPGGTSVSALTLPTDAQMIELQKRTLQDAIYRTFGLTRIDQDTVQGMGQVSGYALEILNRKTEGTFRRVRRFWVRDMKNLFAMTLDLTAYKRVTDLVDAAGNPIDMDSEEPLDGLPFVPFWTVDPDIEFPNRNVEIRMGTGYIVDDVLVRDDFLSKLISRAEALRKRGYSDEEIVKIQQELDEEASDFGAETGLFGGTQAGSTVGNARRSPSGNGASARTGA